MKKITNLLLSLIVFVEIALEIPAVTSAKSNPGVRLQIQDKYVILDNGRLKVTISKPEGMVTGIKYNGIDNLLEQQNPETNRGYWDMVWSDSSNGATGTFNKIIGTSFEVIVNTTEQVEISFKKVWDFSLAGKLAPLNIDSRFIMLHSTSGFYMYAIYEHLASWPGFSLAETRIAFKLSNKWFNYMAISNSRQRVMPSPVDRLPSRCQVLAYPEAVLLTNPVEKDFKGQVDDKYQYSCDNKDIQVHGWISSSSGTGFWHITPSNEYRTGGPTKQSLTSHVGPTSLTVFVSNHYSGPDLSAVFAAGEPWKKVFGPVFIYCNSVARGADWHLLWQNAKQQTLIQVQSWPYSFVSSNDFPSHYQRGLVSGRLIVKDSDIVQPGAGAFVGLALPGVAGSWQRESKGYQFWTRTDRNGNFIIEGIREGQYNLYAWVPGFIGDYRWEVGIAITPGGQINTGILVFDPPRSGQTLWEIGIPDRSALEFNIPDPNPNYINPLYLGSSSDRFRQYGLWDRYTDLYPDSDLVYEIGVGDYRKDWFFAHVPRKTGKAYQGTSWQIKFKLNVVAKTGTYTLRIAIASATLAEVQVRVNDGKAILPLFSTGLIGKDNAIARHGIHGLYWLYEVDIHGSLLLLGDNTIFLTQPRAASPFQGILYDYIRLEGPQPTTG